MNTEISRDELRNRLAISFAEGGWRGLTPEEAAEIVVKMAEATVDKLEKISKTRNMTPYQDDIE